MLTCARDGLLSRWTGAVPAGVPTVPGASWPRTISGGVRLPPASSQPATAATPTPHTTSRAVRTRLRPVAQGWRRRGRPCNRAVAGRRGPGRRIGRPMTNMGFWRRGGECLQLGRVPFQRRSRHPVRRPQWTGTQGADDSASLRSWLVGLVLTCPGLRPVRAARARWVRALASLKPRSAQVRGTAHSRPGDLVPLRFTPFRPMSGLRTTAWTDPLNTASVLLGPALTGLHRWPRSSQTWRLRPERKRLCG